MSGGVYRNVSLAVVIPARNEEATIGRCVRSIQTALSKVALASADIVVVDDASEDLTWERAADAGARVIRHSEQRGVLGAWHTGVRNTSGHSIMFVDADCVVGEDCLGFLLGQLSDPHIGLACGRSMPQDEDSGKLIVRAGIFSSEVLHSVKLGFVDHAFLPIGRLMLLRREAWHVENDELFPCDWVVGLGALLGGWGVRYVPRATVYYSVPSSVEESYDDWLRTRIGARSRSRRFTEISGIHLARSFVRVAVGHPQQAAAWVVMRIRHHLRYLLRSGHGSGDWHRWGL